MLPTFIKVVRKMDINQVITKQTKTCINDKSYEILKMGVGHVEKGFD